MPPTPTETAEPLMPAIDPVQHTLTTWFDGGWVMIPLALLAIFIYYEATALIFYLGRAGIRKVPREKWVEWMSNPAQGTGHIGDVIRYVMSGQMTSDRVLERVLMVKQALIPGVNQKVVVLSVLVTVAPLMGLLGTVIGMLTTFRGLGVAGGQTVDLVAEGIRVALITTQTGLMIAIPGYLFISAILKRRNEYIVFLALLESTAIQQCANLRKRHSADNNLA